ncbi:MAG: glycosyltransferase [Patescibacteria group bacterium]|mgnify:FL=1
MSKIVSHIIVKNGQPFIGAVLKAALPVVDRMLITISKKSNDGTREVIESLQSPKIELYEEEVANLGLLTQERQKQVDMTDKGDIIWFLDDDDFWEEDQARGAIEYLINNDIDAISVNPYQILDKEHEDARWVNKKYFTKFFKNVDINYRNPWPRDLIYKGDELLYHKVNPRNQVVPFKFWHLAAVKNYSFRKNDLTNFNDLEGKPIILEKFLPKEIDNLL